MKRRTALRRSTAAFLSLTICLSALPAFALSIKVLNGSRTPGQAARVGSTLKKHGYSVARVDKADKVFDMTVIYHKDGAQDEARKISDLLPGTQSVKPLSWESQFQIIIVVGNDLPAAPQGRAEPPSKQVPSESPPPPAETTSPESAAEGEITSTPPSGGEPDVPEVEEEPGIAPEPPAEPSPEMEPSPAPEPEIAAPAPAKPKPPKSKVSKPATASSAKPSPKGSAKAAPPKGEPKVAPEPAGYVEVEVANLLKQVADHVGKKVRVQDEFMDQSNYFLGMKDLGVGPEEYVEFFSGESRVNLIVYVPKSNRDVVAALNAFKRGDKVIIHGKVFAKNPIGRPLLMADRLDRE